MTEAYIYDSVRTPRGKGKKDGSLHEVTSLKCASTILEALRDRNDLDTAEIEDVILGCVTPVGEQGGEIARTAVLQADYDESVPGRGAGELYVAGGVEMMSRVPMGSDGFAIAVDPIPAMKSYFVPQGISADIIATKYGFSRDDCDAFAVESQKRAAAAWEDKRFAKSIVAVKDMNDVTILDQDEHMRPGTDMQSLGGLKASFKDMGETLPGFDAVALLKYPELESVNHVHHAGNSSGIVDGAAGLLIGSKEIGEKLGLKPRARIKHTAKIGTDPTIMLTGPVPVTEKVLKETGMTISDFDLFEVNEAFSAVVLRFLHSKKTAMLQSSPGTWRIVR